MNTKYKLLLALTVKIHLCRISPHREFHPLDPRPVGGDKRQMKVSIKCLKNASAKQRLRSYVLNVCL